MEFKLTAAQVEHLRKRFGATVDLRKEFVNAREYMAIHTGRPYKNLGRFFWNWCRRVEERGDPARGERRAIARHQAQAALMAATAPTPREWTRADLEALLEDELPQLREFARDELAKMSCSTDGSAA